MKPVVLIVDDFENTLFIVEFTLKNAGYDVVKAISPVEALSYMDGRKVDLLITDYNMPEMDGVTLAKQFKAKPYYSNIPVLVLTTEVDPDIRKQALDAGITAWVQKPFKVDKFISIIDRVIR